MIIGFGSLEVNRESEIAAECVALGVDAVKTSLHKKEREYHDVPAFEAPERYSYIYANSYNPWDGKTITEITFHHVNRRHAFSPDGWALLVTKGVLIQDENGWRFFREAAGENQ